MNNLPARLALGRDVRGGRRGDPLVPVPDPGPAGAPPPAARARGDARGARRRVASSSAGGTWTSCGPRPASSSAGGSSRAACGGPRRPTRSRRRRGATGCGSPSRTLGDHSAALARLRPGHARRRRGPVRRHDRGPTPSPQGAADRGRRRHHPAARAVRDAPGRARRPDPASTAPAATTTSSSGRELALLAEQRGARLRIVTGRRSELGGDPLSAAALKANVPGLCAARRLRLRPGRHDRGRSRAPCAPPACRAATSTTSRSSSEEEPCAEPSSPSRAPSQVSSCCCRSRRTRRPPSRPRPPRSARPRPRPRPLRPRPRPPRRPRKRPRRRRRGTATAAKTVTGAVVETRYGPVQVRITVKGGRITAAAAVQYPYGDSRSAQISSYAIPTLEPGGRRGRQREHRHGLGRQLHLRRLPPVAPERADRRGPRMSVAPVEHAAHGARRALHGHGVHVRRPRPRPVGRARSARPWPGSTASTSSSAPTGRERDQPDPARRAAASRTPIRSSPRCSTSALPSRRTPAATSRPAGTAASTRPASSRAGRSSARAAFSAPGAAADHAVNGAGDIQLPAPGRARGGSGSATRSTARSC